MARLLSFVAWAAVLLLFSCGNGGRTASSLPEGGDTLELKYAENLEIVSYPDYRLVKLRNPWDTLKTLHTYILLDRDAPQPARLPQGTVVRVPLQQSVVYSSVHCSLLDELGVLQTIRGVCDLSYIQLPCIQEGHRAGRIADLGDSMNPDIEKIIELRPDAILLSPFENSGGYGRLDKLGIPLVECADYMETSPLGRAEWMRFYGLLFGREAEADSLFAQVERCYLTLARQVAGVEHRPQVFCDLKSGSAWYVAGGHSTIGRFYADAGADYVFRYIESSGSVPLSFETVYDKAREADIWLIKYNAPQDKTLRSLEADYAPYSGFRACREGQVYGCNTGSVPYYEETPFHPEWLLADLIKIFHPEAAGAQEWRYFRKLAE